MQNKEDVSTAASGWDEKKYPKVGKYYYIQSKRKIFC